MDSASEINAALRAEQMAAAPKSGNVPKKKIDAKMAATKRKAREAKAKGKPSGPSLLLPALAALVSALFFGVYTFISPVHQSLDSSAITSNRFLLKDGRALAWHQIGASAADAKHHVLVLHDLKGCRHSMLPNISENWLVSRGIRLVSYDRPGYGQSDPHPSRTLLSEVQDLEQASKVLSLPEKFYVVSLGVSSSAAWGMLNSITHRLAGVALVSPWGSFGLPGLEESDLFEAWHSIPRSQRVYHLAARLGPLGVSALAKSAELLGEDWVPDAEVPVWAKVNSSLLQSLEAVVPDWVADGLNDLLYTAGVVNKPGVAAPATGISKEDVEVLQSKPVADYLELNTKEALLQGPGESVFRDWAVVSSNWGFDLHDVFAEVEKQGHRGRSKPRISLWHGSEDKIVPSVFVRYAAKSVPVADVHVAKGKGHFFYLGSREWVQDILGDLLQLKQNEEEAEVI